MADKDPEVRIFDSSVTRREEDGTKVLTDRLPVGEEPQSLAPQTAPESNAPDPDQAETTMTEDETKTHTQGGKVDSEEAKKSGPDETKASPKDGADASGNGEGEQGSSDQGSGDGSDTDTSGTGSKTATPAKASGSDSSGSGTGAKATKSTTAKK